MYKFSRGSSEELVQQRNHQIATGSFKIQVVVKILKPVHENGTHVQIAKSGPTFNIFATLFLSVLVVFALPVIQGHLVSELAAKDDLIIVFIGDTTILILACIQNYMNHITGELKKENTAKAIETTFLLYGRNRRFRRHIGFCRGCC